MKKSVTWLLIAVMIFMTFALTGCQTSEPAADTPKEEVEAEVIKLGLIVPITGKVAVYGMAVENAAKLAVEEANANGGVLGKQIELVVYDNKADATESVNAYNRMVSNDNVDAIVGAVISSTTLTIGPLAVKDGIPMISPTATNTEVTKVGDNVFRACYIDPYQGMVVGQFASAELGAKKAAVMYNTADDYSVGLAEAFRDAFEADGGTITNYEGYTGEDKDFKAILTNIKAEEPDVLFIPDYYNNVGLIAEQVKEMGIDATMLGGDGWDAVETVAPEAIDGSYFANHYAKDDPADVVQNFITAFGEKYDGESPNALAALGYDATNIMLAAMESAGTTDKAAVVKALQATDMPAVTGDVKFNELGDPEKSIAMIQIKDGKQVLAGKFGGK
jgi:branched-chain amino acid transport system substrate-binding protein